MNPPILIRSALIALLLIGLPAVAHEIPDTTEERVKACIICHGPEDKKGRDEYYPRIAGKPEGYLFNQLRNFRDGRRHYRPMALLLEGLPDAYLWEMAGYFASLKQAFPPPEPMRASSPKVKIARELIEHGDAARNIPACVGCHGKDLMGIAPFIPGLIGLPRVYIMAQFGNWQHGALMRGRTPDCMSEIAKKLTTEEVSAVAMWLAAQPVPESDERHAGAGVELPKRLARRCASIIPQKNNPK